MVYTWKENRVLESVDRPRLKMLCEINGIKITEADIKDSLRSVPSKVGDMDGIHMIMGVIETEDRKTRLVTLSNSSVYIFKQGECKFYNQLDKSRIFMKDSHRYGDDNDNDFFWFMYNPSREDLKFFDEENEAKDFARKSGRMIYQEIVDKAKAFIVRTAKKQKYEEVSSETKESIKNRKIEERALKGKFYFQKGQIRVWKDKIYNCLTREYMCCENFMGANWVTANNKYNYRSEIYNIPEGFDTLVKHLFKRPDGLLYSDEQKLIGWLKESPTLSINYFDSSKRPTNKRDAEIADFNLMNKRKLKFTIKLYDRAGKKYMHPHYMINGYRVPKDKMEIAMRFFMNMTDKNFNHFLENVNNYGVKMMEKASNSANVGIIMPTIEDIDRTVNLTIQNEHDFESGKWKRWLKELDVKKTYKDFSEFEEDSFFWYEADWYRKVNNLANRFHIDEEKIFSHCKEVIEKRLVAVMKGELLYKKTLEMFKKQVIVKDGFLIVKGKLKNYKVVIGKDQIETYTYPNERHICVDSGTYKGVKINKYDKAASTIRMLVNDHVSSRRVHTLRNL